jgi:hypothetical protein
VGFQGLTLAVLDVASAQEAAIDAGQVEFYRAQYRKLAQTTSGQTWILQHRPIWSAGAVQADKLIGDNKTLAAAAEDSVPSNVSMILSGHHHLYHLLSYDGGALARDPPRAALTLRGNIAVSYC